MIFLMILIFLMIMIIFYPHPYNMGGGLVFRVPAGEGNDETPPPATMRSQAGERLAYPNGGRGKGFARFILINDRDQTSLASPDTDTLKTNKLPEMFPDVVVANTAPVTGLL